MNARKNLNSLKMNCCTIIIITLCWPVCHFQNRIFQSIAFVRKSCKLLSMSYIWLNTCSYILLLHIRSEMCLFHRQDCQMRKKKIKKVKQMGVRHFWQRFYVFDTSNWNWSTKKYAEIHMLKTKKKMRKIFENRWNICNETSSIYK